jgi:hypothetical protein
MQLGTLAWDPVDGWSADVPELDSPSTLVLLFGDSVVDADRRAVDEVVAGLSQAVPPGVTITGGLAGDGDRFGSTWVLDGAVPSAHRVLAVGLSGEALGIGTGSMGGWGIFGPERTVTRSSGNVLAELDGKPAVELYTRYLGELADQLPASALLFPLAIRQPGSDHQVVRTVLAVDEVEHTMTFAGDMPEGWTAQLMRSSTDRLVDGASVAAAMSVDGAGEDGPALSMAVSCVGRRLVLGERTEEEIEAAVDALAEGGDLIGFTSYGEIAPGRSGRAELHNQTMTVTALRESVAP